MSLVAVILAGGEGRRMGGTDKAMLSLAGRPLIAHLIERLAPQTDRILISANGDASRFAFTGLPVIADDGSHGPLSGILAGLRAAHAFDTPPDTVSDTGSDTSAPSSAAATAVISVPVDAPFLPPDLLPRLATALPFPAFARAGGRDHHATALWPMALAEPLAAFLASGAKPRIGDFAALHGALAVDFPDAAAFANLNTPEDLARAEALARDLAQNLTQDLTRAEALARAECAAGDSTPGPTGPA